MQKSLTVCLLFRNPVTKAILERCKYLSMFVFAHQQHTGFAPDCCQITKSIYFCSFILGTSGTWTLQ